jgi:hypothetical protein
VILVHQSNAFWGQDWSAAVEEHLDGATVVAHRRVESAATAQVSVFCPQCQDNLPAFENVPTDDSRALLSRTTK